VLQANTIEVLQAKRVKTHCLLEGWVSLSQDFRGKGYPSGIFLGF